MSSRSLADCSRGDIVRGLGKTWEDFPHSISDAIEEGMRKVTGAEQVLCKPGRLEDEYGMVYHISPEGVTLRVDLGNRVRMSLYGDDPKKMEEVERRVYSAFRL